MALRLSLGATRGRLVRQMLTESMAIALFGGVAAVAVASAFHGGLVRMLARSDSHFRIAFALDPQVVAFLVGASLATSVLFGLLPAWQVTRTEAGAGLREESRGAVGWLGQQRSGRTLVGVQLALSLPLLVGAGLLARTVRNLEHADLGFPSERLLLVRVDLRDAGYDAARRESFVRELLGEIGRIPGVSAVSFSQLGLFTGGESACAIAVEGHEPAGDDDRSSARDAVGPGYFSTLGMHVVLGREVDFGDASGAPGSCVVNQGFVRRFVAGRDPIGLRITEFEEDAAPTWSCLIVGVVRDARTQDLRESIEPRYFVPGLQAPPRLRSPTFLIRMSAGATGVMAAVRKEVERIDAGLPILSARTLYEQMSPQTAQERTTAQLAAAFGCVALVLAAIGLYGVLSHGIARRTREIAVRIALGARPGTVVWMILRETAGVVAAGLAAGLVLTWAGSSAVHGLLYGVAPRDPLTLAAAAGLLLLVALCAAYAPAGRASRLDPMAALRQE
jgi:predicted permease